jgi:phosphate:Na+ symporter
MMALLFAERAGIPLVVASVSTLQGGEAFRLAAVFFLSNLIPAIVISPLVPFCEELLKRLWPSDAADHPDRPKFLRSQALADPETALDLIPKELGRLFASAES